MLILVSRVRIPASPPTNRDFLRHVRTISIICLSISADRAQAEDSMIRHAGHFTCALVSAVCLAGSLSFSAMAQSTPPNFAPDSSIGWYGYNRQFNSPATRPGPERQDPERPYSLDDEFRVTAKQPTEQLADLKKPVLPPW